MRHFEIEKSIDKFVDFCVEKLKIINLPKIKLLDVPLVDAEHPTLAKFDIASNEILVYIKDRHLADICRSIAHELVHARQNERNQIKFNSGDTGSRQENQSNAVAGILMRDYSKLNPDIIR
jgi:hypothetical protein